jgi:hypothetical protein
MFSDKGFREELSAATDTPSVHALFSNWKPEAP